MVLELWIGLEKPRRGMNCSLWSSSAFPVYLPPRASPSNILSKPIPSNLIPLNLLPRNRQLSPQPFKRTLTQVRKSPVQLLLIFLLRQRNIPNHSLRR